MRDENWKFIEFYDPPKIELYDLAEDIGEQKDLALKMPEKTEQRPRARELVNVTLTGRKGAIKKAMDSIQAIADEWVSQVLSGSEEIWP